MSDIFDEVSHTLRAIVAEMGCFYLERSTTIRNAMLCLLSKQHHFLLGPVGSGKSDLHEELVRRITGAEFFITQLNEQMSQSDLFGQIDVPAFTTTGVWRRDVAGYLPTAHLAMIDEIDKGGPGVTRQLLRVINERKYRVGAGVELDLPLISVVASANEMLPASEAAVWDRFLIREQIGYIAEPANFLTLLEDRGRGVGGDTCIDLDDLQWTIEAVPCITVPAGVKEALLSLRTQLRGQGVVASDRRWLASIRLLQASALLDGREEVGVVDLAVLEGVLWGSLEQRAVVADAVLAHGTAEQKKLSTIRAGIDSVVQGLTARAGQAESALADYAADALVILKHARAELAGIDAEQVDATKLTAARDYLVATYIDVQVKCVGMDPARAQAKALGLMSKL